MEARTDPRRVLHHLSKTAARSQAGAPRGCGPQRQVAVGTPGSPDTPRAAGGPVTRRVRPESAGLPARDKPRARVGPPAAGRREASLKPTAPQAGVRPGRRQHTARGGGAGRARRGTSPLSFPAPPPLPARNAAGSPEEARSPRPARRESGWEGGGR